MKRIAAVSLVVVLVGCPSEKAPEKPIAVPPLPASGLAEWQLPTVVPTQLPLLTVKGLDAFGYPNQLPDKGALLALLRTRHYEQLNKFVEQIADEIDKDFHKELWMFAAMNAFYQAAPDLNPLLEEWVAAFPKSFAPWGARSHYLFAVAKEARGGGSGAETSDAQFKAMTAFTERAAADLNKSLSLRPNVVENIRWRTKVAMFGEEKDARTILADGVKACPDCVTLYQGVMFMLRPNWGGSYKAMDALAEEALASSKNPAMKLLRGASQREICVDALSDEHFDEALAACEKALAAGRWHTYLLARAEIEHKRKQPEKGLPFLNEALEQWPQDAETLGARATTLRKMGKWEEARNDVLLALYLDPNEDYVKWERWQVMREVLKVAKVKYSAKDWKGAEDLYDQALRLQPDDAEPWFWRAMTFKQRQMADAAFGNLQESVKHTRKWLVAYKELATAYVKHEQLPAALEMWNRFIADNPTEAEAIYLRGGIHNRMGNKVLAMADAHKACEMKFDKACNVVANPPE